MSIDALRRANPRTSAGFEETVAAAAASSRGRIAASGSAPTSRRRLARVSIAGAVLASATAMTAVVVIGPPDVRGVTDAAAAVQKATVRSAASAERSGTAVVRITKDEELWAGSTIRWHGGDLSVSQDAPLRAGTPGGEMLLVDGVLYGIESDRGWVVLGSPKSIDPGSGTTPDEYLAAAREDVGGATLRRIVAGVTGLRTERRGDGSTLYTGTVAAGRVARETGFKEGQSIRMLPFGYVAHDEAADASSPLRAAVAVGADGTVREITVTWGADPAWQYTVAYSKLGTAPELLAPKNARPLRERTPGNP